MNDKISPQGDGQRVNNFIKGAPKTSGDKNTPSQESRSLPKKDINSQLGFLRKNIITGGQQELDNNLDNIYGNQFPEKAAAYNYNYEIEEQDNPNINNSYEDPTKQLTAQFGQKNSNNNLPKQAQNLKKKKKSQFENQEEDEELRKSPLVTNKIYNSNLSKNKKQPAFNIQPNQQ